MFLLLKRFSIGVVLMMPVVGFAGSDDQFSQEVRVGYLSADLKVNDNGVDGDLNGINFGYQYYLDPITMDGSVPVAEAAFVQRASFIETGFLSYSAELQDNGAPYYDLNGDVSKVKYFYSNPGSPFLFGVSIDSLSQDSKLIDGTTDAYIKNVEWDTYNLTLGYYLDKTLVVWVSTEFGDKYWNVSDGSVEKFIESKNSIAIKYLKLLGDQTAINFVAGYSKDVSDPDAAGGETDRSTGRGGEITYYFNSRNSLNFGYSAISSSDPSEASKTTVVGFNHYFNNRASVYAGYGNENYNDTGENDSASYFLEFAVKF